MRREKEGPSRAHLDSKIRWVKWMNLLVKCVIKVADGKVVMFHLPGHGISLIQFLNVSEVPNGSDPQLAAKRSVYFNRLSRWLTNKIIIRHSSSSKVVRSVWILALTLAHPSAVPMILHSNGRITYRPSLREILGCQTMLLTCTSPLMAIALEQGTKSGYPSQ